MMVLSGEEVLECEVHDNEIQLENVSEFKYLLCILEESGTDEAESQSVVGRWRVGGGLQILLGLWLMFGA